MSKTTRDLRRYTHSFNRFRGLTPTFEIFDTNPPNPTNITDGDFTTSSGTGIKSLAGINGDIGNIRFDMGAPYNVEVAVWLDVHRTVGNGNIYFHNSFSLDDITYGFQGVFHSSGVGSTGGIRTYITTCGYGRYVKIAVYATGVSTNPSVFHVELYEALAIQVI